MKAEKKIKKVAQMFNEAQKMQKDIHTYQGEASYIEETGKKKEAQREIAKYKIVYQMKQRENEPVEERKTVEMSEFQDDIEKFIPIGGGFYVVKVLAIKIIGGRVIVWHPVLGEMTL